MNFVSVTIFEKKLYEMHFFRCRVITIKQAIGFNAKIQ